MLIALAMTGPAAADPPSDTADTDNTALYEEQQEEQAGEDEATLSEEAQQEQTVEDESQTLAANTAEDAPSDDGSGARAAEEDGTSTAQTSKLSESKLSESKPSESRTFKSELKHALLGLLLPAVERRVRKAVDSDNDTSDPQSNP
jgi:hypothetical protein